MKALISPNESFNILWVSSWNLDEATQQWEPIYSEITDCQRVAQVEPNDKIFEVADPLHWIDCSEDCIADIWYYKNGQLQIKPQDEIKPTAPNPETSSNGEPGVIA